MLPPHSILMSSSVFDEMHNFKGQKMTVEKIEFFFKFNFSEKLLIIYGQISIFDNLIE
jgi:hypothetical protein